jgi:myo-inositol-1(or 4)-monophosphatase
MAVNDLLHKHLATSRPGYGWLSEETEDADDRLGKSRLWLVDPIDGTRSFLNGTENWCIAAALIEDHRPVLGAVYAPISGKSFFARAGGGARLNGELIRASSRECLAGARMIAHEKALRADRWQRAWPHLETGMTTSIALRLCMVADGSYDATLAIGDKSDWDLAAGDLIVSEAGGRVSTLNGAQMLYNRPQTRQTGLIASGASLHDELLARAQSFKG